MKVNGYRCKTQTHNTNIKTVNEFTEDKKKIHLNTGKRFSTNRHYVLVVNRAGGYMRNY
jgi:hypothetical protein